MKNRASLELGAPPPYTRVDARKELPLPPTPPPPPPHESDDTTSKDAKQAPHLQTLDPLFIQEVERVTRTEVRKAEEQRRDPKFEGQEIKVVSFQEHMSRRHSNQMMGHSRERSESSQFHDEAHAQLIKDVEKLAAEFEIALMRAEDRYRENCEMVTGEAKEAS